MLLLRDPIFAGTTTQAVISLSSGESEVYAAVHGVCRTLGLAALMLGLGFSMLGHHSGKGTGITTRTSAGMTHALPSFVVATSNRMTE